MPGPGPRGPRGPKPRVENPGKLMGRLLKYVGKNYGIHLVIVAVCIFVSVIANVQGTMFMKNLIDLYIMPLIGQSSPDFGLLRSLYYAADSGREKTKRTEAVRRAGKSPMKRTKVPG